jgi:adenine-specific DNA-methyltransferase
LKSISFLAIEKVLPELRKAKEKITRRTNKQTQYRFFKTDFLKYQKNNHRKFSFIVGNPPYIKKSLLNKTQIGLCDQIHTSAGLHQASVKNIWPYFLIRGYQLLEENGVLAFILPAELLQVSFSAELRKNIISQFQRVEIFTFDDLLFECKGQDTVLLIAYKQHAARGQFYTHISDVDQLKTKNFILNENNTLDLTETKWIHHLLSSEELTLIHRLGKDLSPISHYCKSKPGLVTAANKFFIVDEQVETLYGLSEYLQPIIQKGLYVNGSVIFDENEYREIIARGKPGKVLCISEEDIPFLPLSVKRYLRYGGKLKLKKGYKCSKRKHWYVIPNISGPADGFFFRRVHHYPKFLKNNAKVLVTDTAYQIEMRDNFHIESLVYSFYNSLTLTFAELGGRYYGGGVL